MIQLKSTDNLREVIYILNYWVCYKFVVCNQTLLDIKKNFEFERKTDSAYI